MPSQAYVLTLAQGQHVSTQRAIGLLEQRRGDSLDAKSTFDSLSGKHERTVRTRFDHWLEGAPPHDKYHHGWPNSKEYKQCYVFKWDEKKLHHRLYGDLCNPKPITNRAFQLCVLVFHDVKVEWETNYSILDRINILRQSQDVQMAVYAVYGEYRREGI